MASSSIFPTVPPLEPLCFCEPGGRQPRGKKEHQACSPLRCVTWLGRGETESVEVYRFSAVRGRIASRPPLKHVRAPISVARLTRQVRSSAKGECRSWPVAPVSHPDAKIISGPGRTAKAPPSRLRLGANSRGCRLRACRLSPRDRRLTSVGGDRLAGRSRHRCGRTRTRRFGPCPRELRRSRIVGLA